MGIVILVLAVAATIATYIVMWSADKCGSQNNSFGACFMVVVLNGLLAYVTGLIIKGYVPQIIISFIATIFALMLILNTRFIQSIIITAIITVMQFVTTLALGTLIVGAAMALS